MNNSANRCIVRYPLFFNRRWGSFCFFHLIPILVVSVLSLSACAFVKHTFKDPAQRSTIYGAKYEQVFQATLDILPKLNYSIISSDMGQGTIESRLMPVNNNEADNADKNSDFNLQLSLARGQYGGVKIEYKKYRMVVKEETEEAKEGEEGGDIHEGGVVEEIVKDNKLFSNILRNIRNEVKAYSSTKSIGTF